MPFPGSLVVKKGMNTRSIWSGAIPHPVSMIEMATLSPFLRVVTVSVPPPGMASTAFFTRFTKTWTSWFRSVRISGMEGSYRGTTSTFEMASSFPSITSRTSSRISRIRCGSTLTSACRTKVRSFRVMSRHRKTASWMASRRSGTSRGSSSSSANSGSRASFSTPTSSAMMARGLLISWAMPAASSPTEASFEAWTSCPESSASCFFDASCLSASLRARNRIRTPIRTKSAPVNAEMFLGRAVTPRPGGFPALVTTIAQGVSLNQAKAKPGASGPLPRRTEPRSLSRGGTKLETPGGSPTWGVVT